MANNLSIPPTTAYGIQAYALAGTRLQGQDKAALVDPTSSTPAGEQSEDQVSLSKEGKILSSRQETPGASQQDNKKTADTRQAGTNGSDQQLLDEAELRQVQQLQQRDAEVRTHEQAHLSAAGQYASGGPSFSYQTGPNGKRYAVGGSVPIDIGKESTPTATIMKMRTVKRAALAPANPSAADRQIAARASMQEMEAMQELQTTQLTENQDTASGAIGKSNNESPENLPKKNTKIAPTSASDIKESSNSTRAIMSAAYKAMASLA
ncbi:MAG: catalase [Proteobacteria bacterium]|nr:catalase [Pseudomonadota bacterium]MBU1649733.1 catalase [Pseudomonadota bacterium]MBU1986468.1 catalase [Pseudomonadota bacterium]